jgi:HD-like signal output (HDOD) protein
MTKLMNKSIKVAALSHVLCRCCGVELDPEEALLAGLVHNIGGVAILDYVRRFPEVLEDKRQLSGTMRALMGESSGLILKKWDFADPFIDAAHHASDWTYSHDGPPSLADIVLIANMHSLIGSRELTGKPRMDELPAYHKLKLDGLTPHASLRLLDEAKQEIQATQALLLHGA